MSDIDQFLLLFGGAVVVTFTAGYAATWLAQWIDRRNIGPWWK